MNIDTRPCNMAPEGNNISPRSLSVNAKKGVRNVSDNPVNSWQTSTDVHPIVYLYFIQS